MKQSLIHLVQCDSLPLCAGSSIRFHAEINANHPFSIPPERPVAGLVLDADKGPCSGVGGCPGTSRGLAQTPCSVLRV